MIQKSRLLWFNLLFGLLIKPRVRYSGLGRRKFGISFCSGSVFHGKRIVSRVLGTVEQTLVLFQKVPYYGSTIVNPQTVC